MRYSRFTDRRPAGRMLANALREAADGRYDLVLALPRGGVPVAYEVALALRMPLDLFLVRKLGVPGQAELAMGAIAEDGRIILDQELIDEAGIGQDALESVIAEERLELLHRERLYRAARPNHEIRGKNVVLVDDGIATGATMRVAVTSVRAHEPAAITVAVPVGAPDTVESLARIADRVVCLIRPARLDSIGRWYRNFQQTSDEEVCFLLKSLPLVQ